MTTVHPGAFIAGEWHAGEGELIEVRSPWDDSLVGSVNAASSAQLEAAVNTGIDTLGDVDIVVANAGVVAIGNPEARALPVFDAIVDTNLKGVWHTLVATVPSIVRKGGGGSIVLVSSSRG